MAKDHIMFDATDANTIIDSDSIGAYVRAADGTLITHTGTALDVSIANASIVVTATNLDIRDLTAASDSVASWLNDGSGNAITSTAGALDVNIKSPLVVDINVSHINDSIKIGDGVDFLAVNADGSINAVVSATDLDIRDLAFATDSVTAHQGGVWNIGTLTSITNDVNIADGGNSITVDAVNLDIRDLVAATDSVSSWLYDGSGNAISSTAGSLNVNLTNASITTSDAALADTAILSSAKLLAAGGTAEAVVTSALANRKYLSLYNNSNRAMYIGSATVSASNGFPVSPGSYIDLRAGAAVAVNYVGAVTGQDLRVLQLS
jgi:hypothetical protein